MKKPPLVTEVIGAIPNRLQLAGGWIDQPFVSQLNPQPPGQSRVLMRVLPTQDYHHSHDHSKGEMRPFFNRS